MDKRKIARMNIYRRINSLLIANADIFQDFDVLVDEVGQYGSILTELEADVRLEQTNPKSINASKKARFKELKALCISLGEKAWVWASKHADEEVQILFNVGISDFKISDMQCITKAQSIHDKLRLNKIALEPYRIVQADIDGLQTAITNAQRRKADFQNGRAQKKVSGLLVQNLQKEADASIDRMENLIKNEYRDTNPVFVETFISTRTPEFMGTRHTTLHGLVKDAADLPLRGAHCKITGEQSMETDTDLTGFYEMQTFAAGEYTLEVSLAGYTTFTQTFAIKLGRALLVDVTLTVQS